MQSDDEIIAVLTYWNGKEERVEIKEEWIADIVSAVQGQYFFSNKEFAINGANFSKVDIYK